MALTPVHRQTLICSAHKLNNRIYNYGYANVINYAVLSLIYNLLDSDLMIEYDKTRLLEHLAQKIETIDPDICTPKIDGGSSFTEDDTIDIPVSVNTAPTVADYSVNISDPLGLTFERIAFTTGFMDSQGDMPGTVIILSLPSGGTLRFNNVEIGLNFQFDISLVGLLTYQRASFEASVHTFTFRISDDNSSPLFSNVAIVTLNLLADSSTNQPATIGDQAIVVGNRAVTTLTLEMFTSTLTPPYNDPEGDLIDAIRIDEISTANSGVFLYNGANVVTGQVITREDISAGFFTHESANQDDISGDVFDFSARDEGSGIWVS